MNQADEEPPNKQIPILMPEDFEPPERHRAYKGSLQPALDLARQNEGRWVCVTTHSSENSAASYISKLNHKQSVVRRAGFIARRIGSSVYVRYVPERDQFAAQLRPDDAPDDDDSVPYPPSGYLQFLGPK